MIRDTSKEHTRGWRHHGYNDVCHCTIMLWWVPSGLIYKMHGDWEAGKHHGLFRL